MKIQKREREKKKRSQQLTHENQRNGNPEKYIRKHPYIYKLNSTTMK